jgi:hypothetical protein
MERRKRIKETQKAHEDAMLMAVEQDPQFLAICDSQESIADQNVNVEEGHTSTKMDS